MLSENIEAVTLRIKNEGVVLNPIELTRTFAVPVEKLFTCWANPKTFSSWWKGLIVKEMNFIRGGKYRHEWEGSPNDFVVGEFQEIIPNSKIVFTWNTPGECAGESDLIENTIVTLKFRSLGETKSELTLTHQGLSTQAQINAHMEGWCGCLQDLAREAGLKVTVTKQFAAPIAKVYEAWINPEFLKRWFSPGNWEVTKVNVDARRGGKYTIALQGKEGQSWEVFGEYTRLVKNQNLSFTWNTLGDPPVNDTIVDVVFRSLSPTTTEVIVVHSGFVTKVDADEHEWGWNACEDRLAQTVTGNIQ